MSTLRDPVGPKDRKVYVRRRILVLAGLLAVIAVVVLVILKPGSDTGVPDASQVELPSDLTSTTEQPDASDDTVPECRKAELRVEAVTDKTDYAEGELPQLSLTVTNAGTKACSADLGTAGMQFVVSSGDDEVWRSVDCQEDPESLEVILEPDEPLVSEPVAWDRTRSAPDTCDITREPVVAGGASYHLRAVAAGVDGSSTAQFLLF